MSGETEVPIFKGEDDHLDKTQYKDGYWGAEGLGGYQHERRDKIVLKNLITDEGAVDFLIRSA